MNNRTQTNIAYKQKTPIFIPEILNKMVESENYAGACKLIQKAGLSLNDFITMFMVSYESTNSPNNWISLTNILINKQMFRFSMGHLFYDVTQKILANEFIKDTRKYGIILSAALLRIDESQRRHLVESLVLNASRYMHGLTCALAAINQHQQQVVVNLLMPVCIRYYNATLLHLCKSIDENNFQRILLMLGPEERAIVNILLSIESQAEQAKFTGIMSSCMPNPGRISYEGGLVSCAQIRDRKRTRGFNPVVLNEIHEFPLFLHYLRLAKRPARERFIITGSHWQAGEAFIDEKGVGNLLIIDSLGFRECMNLYIMIEQFAAMFPDYRIYIADEKRQFDSVSCQVFALDDVKHLFCPELYLPEKYRRSGLYEYFADQTSGRSKKIVSDANVNLVKLPLVFIRTMQSHDLIYSTLSRRSDEERSLPVNNKGEKLFAYARRFFRPDPFNPRKEYNMRITDKWKCLIYYNAMYVLREGYENIEKAKQDFSLAGYKKRLIAQGVDLTATIVVPRARL